jgi:AcrR family transcriptional regulator
MCAVKEQPKQPGRGAPGRPRVPRAVREQEMLDVAFNHFGTIGYQRASMDAIAAEAGVSKPLLYAYFGSKERLFAVCADRAAEQLRDYVRAAAGASDLPPDERLWRGLLSVFNGVERHPEAWRVLYPAGQGADPLSARAASARDAMEHLLADLLMQSAITGGIDPSVAEHAQPLAAALSGATIAMVQWWLRHPEEPKELQVARLMNFAWMGFGDLLAGRLWLPPPDPVI